MELVTVIGYIATFSTLIIGVLFTTQGDVEAMLRYIDPASLFITLGGSVGAMVTMSYISNLKNFVPLVRLIFARDESQDGSKLITTLISFAEKARKEGLLSLEDDLAEMEDPYFKKALQLVIDGTDPEVVKNILTGEFSSIATRHAQNRKMFEDLADLSPAFGLVGTLIGLIFALGSVGGDITILAQGMSTALLTTLYGTVLSNVVWTPAANKLLRKTANEVANKELLLEGVLSIQFGDNPRILQQKLLVYFSKKDTQSVEEPT